MEGWYSEGTKEFEDDKLGWVHWNLLLCTLFGVLFTMFYYYITGGFITDVNGKGTDLGGHLLIFTLAGGTMWLLGMVVFTILLNVNLEVYIDYKRGCITTGVDLKSHVGKYFILTRKVSYCQRESDGLIYNNEVVLHKVIYNKSWLGTYPKMVTVSNLVRLPEIKLKADIISTYVQDYFDCRKIFQVEGTGLTELNDREMEVITIK